MVAGGVMRSLTGEASGDSIPKMTGLCAASLGWQGERQTVVTGGKGSSGSNSEVAVCLLFLSASEAN